MRASRRESERHAVSDSSSALRKLSALVRRSSHLLHGDDHLLAEPPAAAPCTDPKMGPRLGPNHVQENDDDPAPLLVAGYAGGHDDDNDRGKEASPPWRRVSDPIVATNDDQEDNNHRPSMGPSVTYAPGRGLGALHFRRFSRATTAARGTSDSHNRCSGNGGGAIAHGIDGGGGVGVPARTWSPSRLATTDPERQRRETVESMDFAALHGAFRPPRPLIVSPAHEPRGTSHARPKDHDADWEGDNQLETAGDRRRRSRETTAGVSDEDDENEDDDEARATVFVRHHRRPVDELDRAASAQMLTLDDLVGPNDDDDDDDHGDDGQDGDEAPRNSSSGDGSDGERVHDTKVDNAAGLNFDPENLSASVRKLVLQIEQSSRPRKPRRTSSARSNQEDEFEQGMHLTPVLPPGMLEPLTVVANTAGVAPPAMVRGECYYIPMDEVQEELTRSVRRLVIDLKKDAEGTARADALPGFDGDGQQGAGATLRRRRGNSCPPPYRPPPRSSAADSSATTLASVTMDMGPTEPPKARKRSAFARLAPKLFDNFRRKRKSYLYTDEELESIEGARWKIVELAFRFGGKHRFYLVQAVNMFFPLIKYGRRGGPHPTRLHCNRCGTLQWQHKRGGLSEAVDLADVLEVIEGRQTAVFRKYAAGPNVDACSLSLIFKERTLDLETQSSSHRDWLMSALRTLVTYAQKQRQAEHRAIEERGLMTLDELSGRSSSDHSIEPRQASPTLPPPPPMLLW